VSKDLRLCYLSGKTQAEMLAFLAYVDSKSIDQSHWEDLEEHFYAGYRAAKKAARK